MQVFLLNTGTNELTETFDWPYKCKSCDAHELTELLARPMLYKTY